MKEVELARGLDGKSLPSDMHFILPPNDAIGPIVYAYTNAKTSDPPPSRLRWLLTGLFGMVIGLIIGWIIVKLAREIEEPWDTILLIAMGSIGFFFGRSLFIRTIYYVGLDGIEKVEIRSMRQTVQRSILLFDDATHLQVKLDDTGKDGKMEITCKWLRITDGTVIELHYLWLTYFYDKHGHVSLTQYPEYHYYRRAEETWTLHLFLKLKKAVVEEGYFDFQFDRKPSQPNNPFVRIGFDYLELHNKEVTFITGSNIQRLFLNRYCLNYSVEMVPSGPKTNLVFSIDLFSILNGRLLEHCANQLIEHGHLLGLQKSV